MRYLMRDGSPLTAEGWEAVDRAVVAEATKVLAGRRFITVRVLGSRTQNAPIDRMAGPKAAASDFWGRTEGGAIGVEERRFVDLAAVYADFMVSWRDVEEPDCGVQAARDAAVLAANKEDDAIFYGGGAAGAEGIFTARGTLEFAISDWSEGENAVRDLSKCVEALVDAGNSGERALVVSTDLYAKLHRIQPGTGLMEVDRVRGLAGRLIHSNRLKKNSACMVYSDPQNLDLAVGQDMITAYLGNEKLDHVFRVMETMALRIRRPGAIAVLR